MFFNVPLARLNSVLKKEILGSVDCSSWLATDGLDYVRDWGGGLRSVSIPIADGWAHARSHKLNLLFLGRDQCPGSD